MRQALPPFRPPSREPVFNVPGVISALVLAMLAIHAVCTLVLSDADYIEVLALFAFIPGRFDSAAGMALPGGLGADVWTFVTYALLHANWMHVGVNLIWLLAFGSPVARRFGPVRFCLFFAVTAAAGALAHLVSHPGAFVPMIGASAAVSGAMAAAVRFAFAPGGSLSPRRAPTADHQPAAPLSGTLRDPRILGFVGVWFALNFLFGVGVSLPGAEDAQVAWQAHMGGFVAGLLLFPLFDPIPSDASRRPAAR